MKKTLLCFVSLLMITGCSKVKEIVENSSDSIVSNNASLDSSYYPIVSFDPNTGRNEYYNNYGGSSDFIKVGRELEVLSNSYFSSSNHYMSEGQVLSYSKASTDLLRWKTDSRPYSLQLTQEEVVEEKTQIILAETVYELDFYQKNNDNFELAGMSFGLVIDPKVRLESGSTISPSVPFSNEFIKEYSEEIINTFYEYTRQSAEFSNYQDIPILISVYLMTDDYDKYGGAYIYKSYCNGSVGKIETINFDQVVFSSSAASTLDAITSDEFSQFRNTVKNNCVEAVGAVGYGTYRDGKLDTLNITISCNVKTYVEVEYLVGIVALQLNSAFSAPETVVVKIQSQDTLEAIVVKERSNNVESYMVNY